MNKLSCLNIYMSNIWKAAAQRPMSLNRRRAGKKNININKLIFVGVEQTQSEITEARGDVCMKNSFGT